MTDSELQAWWPDLGIVVSELRFTDRPAVADLLVDTVRVGGISGKSLVV